jgi:hypothetical protein
MSYAGPGAAAAPLAALAVFLLALLAAPAPAAAQGYTCEASALALELGPGPRTEPITANKGQPECRDAAAGGNPPASPLPVGGSLLSATTNIEGDDPVTQVASAAAGLGQLRIAGLPIPLERPDLSGLPGPTTIPGVATMTSTPRRSAWSGTTSPTSRRS